MSMMNYFSWILNLVIFVFSGLIVTCVFCAVGWFLTCRELKQERIRTSMFKAENNKWKRNVESFAAENSFLSRRVSKLTEEKKLEKEISQKLLFEKIGLEDKLRKALAAVRKDVCGDTENQGYGNSSDEEAAG